MPRLADPTGSVRWQALTSMLETLDRWGEHCARMVELDAERAAGDTPGPGRPAGEATAAVYPTHTLL